jgi:hypothetical protein
MSTNYRKRWHDNLSRMVKQFGRLRGADVRQERALPEWNRCNQRLTETRVSNITHYGIGHFQRRNLARDTFLAVTHVPHPFAA